MKVLLINSNGTQDISEFITQIKWKGERSQVARSISFGIIYQPTNSYVPKVPIQLGHVVKLLSDSGTELFQGYVWSKESADNSNELSITAYDNAIYLLKNKVVYNFKGLTPEDIATKVCKDIGFPVGSMAKTGIKINRIFNGVSAYEVIQTAYTMAHQRNGKMYMPMSKGGKLSVIEKGQHINSFTLQSYDDKTGVGNITNSKYTEDLDSLVNKVLITDEKGKVVSTVADNNLIKLYGTIQEVYKKEKDKDATPIAKALIKGVNRTASLEALGIVDCITGYSISVKDKHTGLLGKFSIEGDEHTFSEGQHTMSLTLSFENIMEEVEAGETGS